MQLTCGAKNRGQGVAAVRSVAFSAEQIVDLNLLVNAESLSVDQIELDEDQLDPVPTRRYQPASNTTF